MKHDKRHSYEIYHKKSSTNKIMNDVKRKDYPRSWINVEYKGYARMEEIQLPKPKKMRKQISLAFMQRISVRKFASRMVAMEKLSSLLYYSAGLHGASSPTHGNRFYPSAGCRYPLEVYLISLNTDLPRGIYHYYLKNNSLEKLAGIKHIDLRRCFYQPMVKKSSFLILITAIFNRTVDKYGERGYRYALLEAGHLGQNICLAGSALQMPVCPVGGYSDSEINKLIEVDGRNEGVVYTFAVGG